MTSVEVIGDIKGATCLTGFPNSERLQLFDVVTCSTGEERGNMALGLVVLTVVVVGYTIHWLVPSMPLAVAFTLGAIVTPPDAVATEATTAGRP